MFYFYGEWKNRSIDEKGRFFLPSVFKKNLKEYIITGNNDKIRIFLSRGKLPFSKIYRGKPDKEGRILIPFQLRKGWLRTFVTLVGKGEYLELRRKK